MSSFCENGDIHPKIHAFPIQQQKHCNQFTYIQSMNDQAARPHLIIIPCEDEDGRHQEVLRQVYAYPKDSITTVVEKSSRKVEKEDLSLEPVETKSDKKSIIHKRIKNVHGSRSSLSSAVSTNSSSSSKSSRWKTASGIEPHFPITSIPSCLQPSLSKSFYVDGISDTSSNASDLSGYEDEYSAIRRFISDAPSTHRERILSTGHPPPRKVSPSIERIHELESLVKSLQNGKEDSEIQIHRFKTQLQNASRTKDFQEEQIDLLQTKLVETERKEYFEILKEKSNLEGQYKVLKQEYDNVSTDKNILSSQLLDLKNALEQKHESLECMSKNNLCIQEELKLFDGKKSEREDFLLNLQKSLESEKELSQNLKINLENCQKMMINKDMSIEQQETEIVNLHHSLDNVHKRVEEYKSNEKGILENKLFLQTQLDNYDSKYKSLTTDYNWCKNQVENSQKIQLQLQNELGDCKNSLSLDKTEKDRLKNENEKLSSIIEDNRANAVREKSALLLHLEEVEADMKDRETASRLQENENAHRVKLPIERLKKLEDDHKRLQNLRIQFNDLGGENKSLLEELKHKRSNIRRMEIDIRDLSQNLVTTQEKLGEKDVTIASVNEQNNDLRSKLECSFVNCNDQSVLITELKEQNFHVETKLKNVHDDKTEVDATISKLREDVNKLSTNYYRMKHDITVKDRQVEALTRTNSNLVEKELDLRSELENLISESKSSTKVADLEKEIVDLISREASLNSSISENGNQISALKNSIGSCGIENKSLSKEINVRDEQISNLQSTLVGYKEKLLLKDEEIYSSNDHIKKLERSCSDLQTKFTEACGDLNQVQQEKEEFIALEANLKITVKDLKESLKLEKGGKDVNERKLNKIKQDVNLQKQQHNNE